MTPSPRHLLWWGRFDPAYSRNGILRRHLADLGWRVTDFHPRLCSLAHIEAALRRLPTPSAVWVPCFRQRDLPAASRFAARRNVPLLFDPLISAYDKQVFERAKLPESSPAARRLLRQERALFALPDLLLADTPCHVAFFRDTLGVPSSKLRLVYVGADESMFVPVPEHPPYTPLDVLFYGSFIPLHGAPTIIEAARAYSGPPVRWHLLGDGPAKPACLTAAADLPNVTFEDKIPYPLLPARIHRADILLGVFGTTPKAGRVIPNKVFQALAAGRPVITRASDAYPPAAAPSEALALIPPGDPAALAAAVAAWASAPDALASRNRAALALYNACFSAETVRAQLAEALAALFPA